MSPHPQQSAGWLAENGAKELELLFRAIVFQPSTPILLADDDRRCREASVGAAKLLGLPREKIISRSLDDFVKPGFRPVMAERWRAFLEQGEQDGTLQLVDPAGGLREVEYSAKVNVLPVRHLLVLRDKTHSAGGGPEEMDEVPCNSDVPTWVQDYALFLLDVHGQVVAWYAGAERIFGYRADEVIGQHASLLDSTEEAPSKLTEKLRGAASTGHFGAEGWRAKKDGTRFWANVITIALRDGNGDLQGFAKVVRDFSDRHERDEKLRQGQVRPRPLSTGTTVAGIISGEFDQIPLVSG